MEREQYFKELVTTRNPFIELSDLMEKLKKNEESCPKEILETKYKTGYENLKEKIRLCIKALIALNVKSDVKFLASDTEAIEKIQEQLSSYIMDEDNMIDVYKAAFTLYNYDLVVEEVIDKAEEAVKRYYMPYFLSKIAWDEEHGALYCEINRCWRIDGKWKRPYEQSYIGRDGKRYTLPSDSRSYAGFPASVEEMKTYAYKSYTPYVSEIAKNIA